LISQPGCRPLPAPPAAPASASRAGPAALGRPTASLRRRPRPCSRPVGGRMGSTPLPGVRPPRSRKTPVPGARHPPPTVLVQLAHGDG
jgi:hypothetical protein